MTTLTWRQQAEAAFRSAIDGTARVTGSRDAMAVTALHAALDVAELLVREDERAEADQRCMGGMGIAVAVERAVRLLGITPRESHKRALRWLYEAGVAAGVDIWKRSGDLEPEQVTAIRSDERERCASLIRSRFDDLAARGQLGAVAAGALSAIADLVEGDDQ